ncbi:MAG: tRNA dihydrouridine synthase DusB, partial [Bacteroidaceae bacterium]|nr:tRNA dihydrouridine synthase DusB [Bacteroidaceae bacterium]
VKTSIKHLDEYRGILHVRRHLAATPLFKGIANFREHRIAMLRAETADKLFELMEQTRELISEKQ